MRTLLLFLLWSVSMVAADLLPEGRVRVRAYTEEMGLRSQNVTAIAQDSDGILFVGTGAGLFRFGGEKFTLIPLRKDVAAPMVLSLLPHPQGGMWVGTMNGLAWVRGQEVRWATMAGTKNNLIIGTMGLDETGRLWFPDHRGMFRQTGESHFEVDPATRSWAREGLWLAHSSGQRGIALLEGSRRLHRLRRDGGWESQVVDVPIPDRLEVDREGTLWHFHGQEIRQLRPGGSAFELDARRLPAVLADNAQLHAALEGGLWVPTTLGLVRISDGPDEWVSHRRGLPDEGVFLVYPDAEGNLWCGGVGLYRVQSGRWFQAYDMRDGLPGNVVWAVARVGGRLLVGTQVGLAELKGGQFRPVEGTRGFNVSQILEHPDGSAYVVARGGGLLRLAAGATAAVRVPEVVKQPSRVALGQEGRLYVNGGQTGLLELVPKPGGGFQVHPVDVPKSPTGGAGVNRVVLDRQGRLWATSWWGLLVREGGAWKTFTTQDGLTLDTTQDLVVAPEGDLWLRYEEPVGVTRLRYEGGKLTVVEHLRAAHGLTTDLVYAVLPEPDGNLWLTTDRGVFRRRGGVITNFTRLDGLPSNDCDEDAIWKDADGTVWVGQSNGLVRFGAEGTPAVIPPPQSRVVGLADAHRTWLLPEEPSPSMFSIREASLTFRFGPRRLQDEGPARYQVRLEGLEEEWRSVDGTFVQYPGLREGHYAFSVRAARVGEAWGPAATFAFQVTPPWYRTWGAYGIALIFLGALAWQVVQWRLRVLTRQRDHLETVVRTRTQEIEEARAELLVANENLKAQSLTDPLTGLHNRRYLQEALPLDVNKVVHLHRFAGRSGRRGDQANPDLVFLLVDIDHFKPVNDTYGHDTGDRVLREMAGVLRRAMRDTDAIVRWGGEEFLVVARETCRREGDRLAERIRSFVEDHEFRSDSGLRIPITCSVGFAPFPLQEEGEHAVRWERAVNLADGGLYVAKRSGRNGWVGVRELHQDVEGTWTLPQMESAWKARTLELASSFKHLCFEGGL